MKKSIKENLKSSYLKIKNKIWVIPTTLLFTPATVFASGSISTAEVNQATENIKNAVIKLAMRGTPTHEEKVFGGYLSLRQMLYMILSLISVGILFIKISIVVRVLIFLGIIGIFMTFAFFKVGNVYSDKYFLNIIKYIFRKKTFMFGR